MLHRRPPGRRKLVLKCAFFYNRLLKNEKHKLEKTMYCKELTVTKISNNRIHGYFKNQHYGEYVRTTVDGLPMFKLIKGVVITEHLEHYIDGKYNIKFYLNKDKAVTTLVCEHDYFRCDIDHVNNSIIITENGKELLRCQDNKITTEFNDVAVDLHFMSKLLPSMDYEELPIVCDELKYYNNLFYSSELRVMHREFEYLLYRKKCKPPVSAEAPVWNLFFIYESLNYMNLLKNKL